MRDDIVPIWNSNQLRQIIVNRKVFAGFFFQQGQGLIDVIITRVQATIGCPENNKVPIVKIVYINKFLSILVLEIGRAHV